MNCEKTEKLIMNYMDNILSVNEAKKLNTHLKTCDKCKEEFAIYEMILDSMEHMEIQLAPKDFEEKLMIKISNITPEYTIKAGISLDTVNSVLWGTFTIVFGTGIMLNIYKEPIMQYITQNENIASFYQTITPIGNLMSQYINEFFTSIESITISMSGVLNYTKIICTILIVLLCLVQVWIKRNKVDA